VNADRMIQGCTPSTQDSNCCTGEFNYIDDMNRYWKSGYLANPTGYATSCQGNWNPEDNCNTCIPHAHVPEKGAVGYAKHPKLGIGKQVSAIK
jgi:hypothetical protein